MAKRPALLRECTAELAPMRIDLVELAIRTIDIELIDREIVEAASDALQEWDASTIERDPNGLPRDQKAAQERSSRKGKSSSRRRPPVRAEPRGDMEGACRRKKRFAGRLAADAPFGRPCQSHDAPFHALSETAKAFGEVYALIVDRSIERNVKRAV